MRGWRAILGPVDVQGCRNSGRPSGLYDRQNIGAHAARLLHCMQKTQPVFEFTAQSVVTSSMANRCL
jgi:hypothetical protein